MRRVPLTIFFALAVVASAGTGGRAAEVTLHEIDPGTTSPTGQSRWLDVADQPYSASYRSAYRYNQASVQVTYTVEDGVLRGALTAVDLKPNFAYQLKLLGAPAAAGNESIGFTGRWWEQIWTGSDWTAGWNLNNKGDGSFPNPNDLTYLERRDVPDDTSPTSLHYLYTAYLVLDYFMTDGLGNASFNFTADSSYHVLWKSSQRTRTGPDGPDRERTFDADPLLHPAYDVDYPEQTVTVYGEWERLPVGGVRLPLGEYECQVVLTEESFHGSGGDYAGNWAAAMGGEAAFIIVEDYTLNVSSTPITGVEIGSTTGHGGSTAYQTTLCDGTIVALSAPSDVSVGDTDYRFVQWTGAPEGTTFSGSGRTISFVIAADTSVMAEYEIVTWPLSVTSFPITGIAITSTTGHGGSTDYQLTVDDNSPVTLTAPAAAGGLYFQRWEDGSGITLSHAPAMGLTVNAQTTLSAVYGDLQLTDPSEDGMTLQWGQTYVIHWRSNLSSRARMKIELWNLQGERWEIAPSVTNRGLWRWRVGKWNSKTQPAYAPGEGYRIRVSASNGIVSDFSDYPFAIGHATGVAITGENIATPAPTEVAANGSARITCRCAFSFGNAQDVTGETAWKVTDANGKRVKYAKISRAGLLTAGDVPSDLTCRIEATYRVKGTGTFSADAAITIRKVP